jgi:hypothetical protein
VAIHIVMYCNECVMGRAPMSFVFHLHLSGTASHTSTSKPKPPSDPQPPHHIRTSSRTHAPPHLHSLAGTAGRNYSSRLYGVSLYTLVPLFVATVISFPSDCRGVCTGKMSPFWCRSGRGRDRRVLQSIQTGVQWLTLTTHEPRYFTSWICA